MNNKEIRLGLIGYRNHAKRLIDLLHKKKHCEISVIYHPSKSLNIPNSTNSIDKLNSCDAVFIASPNHTHIEYLQYLIENRCKYIFCEKPPVTTIRDLEQLEALDQDRKRRIYFNFNYRFSYFNDVLRNQKYQEYLGRILHINITSTHGLAFKDGYAESWRAGGEENLHAITETVGIHYVDLLSFYFGEIDRYYYSPMLNSNKGSSFDTALINLLYPDMTASIYVSYACPSIEEITIIGTNGYLTIRDNESRIFSPRDTFNSKGFFIPPPLVERKEINIQDDYEKTLSESLDFFVKHVQGNRPIDLRFFESSMLSNKFILSLKSTEHFVN